MSVNVLQTPTIISLIISLFISQKNIIIVSIQKDKRAHKRYIYDLIFNFRTVRLYIQTEMANQKFDPTPFVTPFVTLQEVLHLKTVFDLFDRDHGGSIDPKQLKEAIAALGIQTKAQAVYKMIAQLDADGSGSIEFDQFYEMMTHTPNQQESRQQIHKVFIMFDVYKTGFVTIKELRKIAKELGELPDDFFLQEMINRGDADADGSVSQQQFYNLMTKKAF